MESSHHSRIRCVSVGYANGIKSKASVLLSCEEDTQGPMYSMKNHCSTNLRHSLIDKDAPICAVRS